MSKSFFIDLSKCTACRGCQVACKQWHKLPAEKTVNRGSYQNPADLSYVTYKLVHFTEHEKDGKLHWLFFPEQCRHCVEPSCKLTGDSFDPGAVLQDEATGAVVFTEKTKSFKGIEEGSEICPYNIPRRDPATGQWAKCDMCLDRVQAGKLPACVLTCSTGAMNFGEREEMLAMAQARLAEVKQDHPEAVLGDPDSVCTIYLFPVDPTLYHASAVAEASGRGITRQAFLAALAKPLHRLFT